MKTNRLGPYESCLREMAPKKAKNKAFPLKNKNKAFPLKNKIAVACAKLLNKVIPKSKALEDKSRSDKSSPEGVDPKRSIKTNIVGTTIRINGEGCILAQNLTPKGENTKRPMKLTWGGLRLSPNGGR